MVSTLMLIIAVLFLSAVTFVLVRGNRALWDRLEFAAEQTKQMYEDLEEVDRALDEAHAPFCDIENGYYSRAGRIRALHQQKRF